MSNGLSPTIAAALDRYESTLAAQVGRARGRELRREMESHLIADIATRVEAGIPETEAQSQALTALGDLRRAARAEPPRHLGLGRIFLFTVPWLMMVAFVTQPGVIRLPALPAFTWTALQTAACLSLLFGTLCARRKGFISLVLGSLTSSFFLDAFGRSLRLFGRRGLVPGAMEQAVSGVFFLGCCYLFLLAALEASEQGLDIWKRRRAE